MAAGTASPALPCHLVQGLKRTWGGTRAHGGGAALQNLEVPCPLMNGSQTNPRVSLGCLRIHHVAADAVTRSQDAMEKNEQNS